MNGNYPTTLTRSAEPGFALWERFFRAAACLLAIFIVGAAVHSLTLPAEAASDNGVTLFVRTDAGRFPLPANAANGSMVDAVTTDVPQYTQNDYGPYDDPAFLARKFIGTKEKIRNPWLAKEKGRFIFSTYWAAVKTLPDLTPVGTRSHSDFRVFVSKNADEDGWNAWFILKINHLGESSYCKADFAIWRSRGTDGRWHAMTETASRYEDIHKMPKDTVEFTNEDSMKILLDDSWMYASFDKSDLGKGYLWDNVVDIVPLGQSCLQRIQAERRAVVEDYDNWFGVTPTYIAAHNVYYPYAFIYNKTYGDGVMACIGNYYYIESPRTIICADTLDELYEILTA